MPLDERPVNTRYPQMLGEIGGASVLLPPAEIRGLQRVPADVDAVAAWLRNTASTADAAVVSCEYLGFGNLIAARSSEDSAADVLSRLRLLGEINPACPVHAFSLITRVSNADDAVEEPDYWAEWGNGVLPLCAAGPSSGARGAGRLSRTHRTETAAARST